MNLVSKELAFYLSIWLYLQQYFLVFISFGETGLYIETL